MTSNYTYLPYDIIANALDGGIVFLNEAVEHYQPYILSLCRRELIDENGNHHVVIDETMKRRIETRLLMALVSYKKPCNVTTDTP